MASVSKTNGTKLGQNSKKNSLLTSKSLINQTHTSFSGANKYQEEIIEDEQPKLHYITSYSETDF